MTSETPKPIHDPLPEALVEGYEKFTSYRLPEEQGRFRQLAEDGQKPPVLLIGCCDSRVSPEVIFDARPGEIFVVRNIAALVPPYRDDGSHQETAAAIEYAVLALGVAHIVVMGHAQCGGIRAYALEQQHEFKPLSKANFVAAWKSLIRPAAETLGATIGDFDHYCETLSYASIIQGMENLRTYPWVREREEDGRLSIHGAYFGVANGRMTVLDQAKGVFVPVIPGTK
jgi:carbonic anhydrase